MSENMYNILKVNANFEINDKNFVLFPVSQINVRFSVECTKFKRPIKIVNFLRDLVRRPSFFHPPPPWFGTCCYAYGNRYYQLVRYFLYYLINEIKNWLFNKIGHIHTTI